MTSTDRADTRALFWWAFALRFGIGLLAWNIRDLTSVVLLEDAAEYEAAAASVAADWLAGRPALWLHNALEGGTLPWLMVILLASIKYLFGGLDVLPLLLAIYCLLNAWTPVLIYRITQECGGDRRSALLAGRIVAFLPAFAFWSGALYKDGLVFLTLSLIILHTLRLQRGFRLTSFLVLMCALPALYSLRFYMALIAAAAVAISLLFGTASERRNSATPFLIVRQGVILALFGGTLLGTGLGRQFADLVPRSMSDLLQRIDISRTDLADASSGYLSDVIIDNTRDAVAFLPRSIAYFLTAPMPWQLGTVRQNMAIPDTAIWLLLYPLAALGWWRLCKRNRPAAALFLIVSVATVLFYGLFAGNIGTAYRMRTQVWLVWAVLAGMGWSSILRTPESARAGSRTSR